jgi:stage II sporulation protein D
MMRMWLRAITTAAIAAGVVACGPLPVTPAGAPGAPATVKVGLARGRGYQIVEMPLEAYVAGVLAGEAAPRSDTAALQALAITIRTYTVANLGRHRAQGFDLCDQTHCQVYRAATPITKAAAAATAGEILLYQHAPATVYFSAWCGGYTEQPSHVWPGAADVPYLPARPDPACARLPGWSTALTTVTLERALHTAGYRGRLRRMDAIDRDRSGRITALWLDGMTPSTISGQDLRMAVGATVIKSTAFTMNAVPGGYELTGHGFGHGVGLCELGAAQMAAHGKSAAEILAAYFPGTTIAPIGGGASRAIKPRPFPKVPSAAGPAPSAPYTPSAGRPGTR